MAPLWTRTITASRVKCWPCIQVKRAVARFLPSLVGTPGIVEVWRILWGYAWGPPEIDPFGPLHHVQPVARLGGHSLVFQGHFDLPVVSAESHSAMAQLLAGEGRMEEALTEARTGVALAPQAMDTHLSLAQVLVQAKQLPAARVEYLESIRLAEAQGEGYWWGSIGPARQGLAQVDATH